MINLTPMNKLPVKLEKTVHIAAQGAASATNVCKRLLHPHRDAGISCGQLPSMVSLLSPFPSFEKQKAAGEQAPK